MLKPWHVDANPITSGRDVYTVEPKILKLYICILTKCLTEDNQVYCAIKTN